MEDAGIVTARKQYFTIFLAKKKIVSMETYYFRNSKSSEE
jgi:hypothetical protein